MRDSQVVDADHDDRVQDEDLAKVHTISSFGHSRPKIIIIIIIIIEAFIKRRIPGKTTCSKALQYNSNTVVIKIK